MITRIKRIADRIEGRRSAALLVGLSMATVAAVALACELPNSVRNPINVTNPIKQPGTTARVTTSSGVQVTGVLSQTKLVRGESGEVYLRVSVTTPEMPKATMQQATDTVVILDHSGSMSVDNRLPYAKRAIHDLVDRLTPQDRFALVVFDSGAQVLSSLNSVTPEEKRRLHLLVDQIQPGSGTNLGAGIELARSILRGRNNDRVQKAIVLSDGEANEGITSPQALGQMTSAINRESATVSTIGMGLGFNEQLMSSLADWGGGTFSYLEHLDKLAEILNRNLQDSRSLFATTSTIEIALPEGARVVDAGGYPIDTSAGIVKIPTGQLLSGTEKQLTITMNLPTSNIGEITGQRVAFEYGSGEAKQRIELPASVAQVSVVEEQRRPEAVASINQAVYGSSWGLNNLGILKRDMREKVAAGDIAAAKSAVSNYRTRIAAAEAVAGAPIATDALRQELSSVVAELDDAERGDMNEQKEKQNRLGKKLLKDGLSAQRSY